MSFYKHFIAKYVSFLGKYARKTLPKVPFDINLRILNSSKWTLSLLEPSDGESLEVVPSYNGSEPLRPD